MTAQPLSLIIDSDPGVDDVMAILLALNHPNIDLKLISLVFGNCDTVNSLRNTVSTFHVLKMEQEYRERLGMPCPWLNQKPIISVGLTTALDGSKLDATEFHGSDGLCNIHINAPQYTASQEQIDWFTKDVQDEAKEAGFIPSSRPSYLEILDVLKREPPNTVTIAAIGPMQNLALAAELDPRTFSRVKEILIMGGTLQEPGNVSPYAEFNVFADPVASARIYALTGNKPEITLPSGSPDALKNFPKPISITLFPLDITHRHGLLKKDFDSKVTHLVEKGSPLAHWLDSWLGNMFETEKKVVGNNVLTLHDALTVLYAATSDEEGWVIERGHDIRVETEGQWTRGVTVIDNRNRPRSDEPLHNDRGTWLMNGVGNRVNYAKDSPASGNAFGSVLLDLVL